MRRPALLKAVDVRRSAALQLLLQFSSGGGVAAAVAEDKVEARGLVLCDRRARGRFKLVSVCNGGRADTTGARWPAKCFRKFACHLCAMHDPRGRTHSPALAQALQAPR